MENKPYQGQERRNYERIVYKPVERPKIQIENDIFEIADVSEKGLRFINNNEVKLDNWIRGTLTFLNGGSVDVEGMIEREQGNDFGLYLEYLIPPDMIFEEQRHIILNCD